MTRIICNNLDYVFHPMGFCIQSEITIGDKGCMDALTEDEYAEIMKVEEYQGDEQ